MHNEDGFASRQYVFRLNSPDCDPEIRPQTSINLIRQTVVEGGRSGSFVVDQDGKTAEDLIGVSCSLHGDDSTVDAVATVSHGAWKTLSTFRPGKDQAGVIKITGEGELLFNDPVEKDGKTKLMVTVLGPLVVYRVIAVDDQGVEHAASELRSNSVVVKKSGRKILVITGHFNLPLSNIKAYHIQTRPFKTIEFKNLPVMPKLAVEDKVMSRDRVIVEDMALHMIVAFREKDDARLRELASDRIKGWPDSLPVFAVELREHFRRFTGSDTLDLQANGTLVDGKLAVVRCTGPEVLKGKCLYLFFEKTDAGWKNVMLRNGMDSFSLEKMLARCRKELEKADQKTVKNTSEEPPKQMLVHVVNPRILWQLSPPYTT